MADFAELLGKLREPGEDGLPETIYDDLEAAYTHDTSTRDAKIGELTESTSASAAEIERLKAANYDLNNLIPAMDGETGGDTTTEVEVQSDGLDALFERPLDDEEESD